MDVAVLLTTMFFCFFIGVPIAYSLALAAIAGALWIGIPLEAVMLKISDGVSKVAMLTIPFFVLAGAIMGTCFASMWFISMYQLWLSKVPTAVKLRREVVLPIAE